MTDINTSEPIQKKAQIRRRSRTIKNQIPEILEALCYHPDCPEWLSDGIWDLVNNNGNRVIYTADYWRAQLQSLDDESVREIEERINPELNREPEIQKLKLVS